MEWIGRNAMKNRLFFVVFRVEFSRIAQTQHLTGRMARENAVRTLGFEGNNRDVPRTGPIRRRHAAARQPLERFELENGACRPDGADGRRWDCHTVTLQSSATRCG